MGDFQGYARLRVLCHEDDAKSRTSAVLPLLLLSSRAERFAVRNLATTPASAPAWSMSPHRRWMTRPDGGALFGSSNK